MSNKNIFPGIPPLYVNFAMKKGERQELLMKQREELYKKAQKMTVYAKIKNEALIVKNISFNIFFRIHQKFSKLKSNKH